jgi:hypothetical protein
VKLDKKYDNSSECGRYSCTMPQRRTFLARAA